MTDRQTLSLIWAAIEWLPYDREALAKVRVIMPRSLVAGRDVYDQGVEDLSESESHSEPL